MRLFFNRFKTPFGHGGTSGGGGGPSSPQVPSWQWVPGFGSPIENGQFVANSSNLSSTSSIVLSQSVVGSIVDSTWNKMAPSFYVFITDPNGASIAYRVESVTDDGSGNPVLHLEYPQGAAYGFSWGVGSGVYTLTFAPTSEELLQIPTWTLSASSASAGLFYPDNVNPQSTSVLNFSATDLGGSSASQQALSIVPVGSALQLIGPSGSISFIVTVSPTFGSFWSIGVAAYGSNPVSWPAGNYGLLLSPGLQTPDQIGAATSAQGAKADSALQPDGDGGLLGNVLHPGDIGSSVLSPNGDGSNLTGLNPSQVGSIPNTLGSTVAVQKGNGTGQLADASLQDVLSVPSTDVSGLRVLFGNFGIVPIADGTYTVGLGVTNNGTITLVGGLITDLQQAS